MRTTPAAPLSENVLRIIRTSFRAQDPMPWHLCQPPRLQKNRRRGRPKKYGKKIRISQLFNDLGPFSAMKSPVYGEQDVSLKFLTIDLIWKSLGEKVRFVLVDHPNRGRIILMTSDLSLEASDIIIAYGLRFKIEVSFKQALEGVGAYAYHLWMQSMKPIKRRSGNQHLHRESEKYRMAVKSKMAAFHTPQLLEYKKFKSLL